MYRLSRKYLRTTFTAICFIGLFPPLVQAEGNPQLRALEHSLHYQQGVIPLLDGNIIINTGDKFRYLSPADSEKVLVEGWGNPPSDEPSLGMLVPAGISPLDNKGWGAELSFEDDSYISDDDASTINYDDVLQSMKQQNLIANKERERLGYSALNLLGWAEAPHYDQSSHTIYWAKRLSVDNEGESVNYYIRNLGRHGVFNINVIASSEELPVVKNATPDLLKVASFAKDNRYEDHRFWDTTSTYGLAALVAGGAAVAAKKVGIVGLVLLFAKKFVVVVIAALAWLGKVIFGRKKE